MILRGAECDNIGSICQREKACFFARHKFLDHHRCTGIAKSSPRQSRRATAEHIIQRGQRIVMGFGNDNALTRRQPIRFYHIGNREFGKPGHRIGFRCETLVISGRNTRRFAKILGKTFRSFQLRRQFVRTKDRYAGVAQAVTQTRDQWTFRSDHDQANVVLCAK